MNQLRNRESRFWKCYETWSSIIGITAGTFLFGGFIANLTTIFEPSLPRLAQVVQQWMILVSPYAVTILIAIIFLDKFKFKATNDPRDEPGRKWWSKKYSGRFLPDEIVILQGNVVAQRTEALTLQLCTFTNHQCPKCSVTHAFKIDENTSRKCCFYGCQEIIHNPSIS